MKIKVKKYNSFDEMKKDVKKDDAHKQNEWLLFMKEVYEKNKKVAK
jgi:hypothetical protein